MTSIVRGLLFSITLVLGGLSGCGGGGGSDGGTDNSTPTASNRTPVANAGSDSVVALGSTVTLDGSSSTDSDGDALTYQWSFLSLPSGSSAEFNDSTVESPSFIADQVGTYEIQLVVNDGSASSTPDTVIVKTNTPPRAEISADKNKYLVNSTVQLYGEMSADADDDSLSFEWRFVDVPDGSSAQFSNSSAVSPTFVANVEGDYVVELVVNDGIDSSEAATHLVKVVAENTPPVADGGGDQFVTTGTLVTLDGSGSSDVDGDSLTYSWRLWAAPEGSSALFDNIDSSNPTTTFTPDIDGVYKVHFVVNDGVESSAPDSFVVTAATGNSPPVADAGENLDVVVGTRVTLDGSSSSDADGHNLSYLWSFKSLPEESAAEFNDSTYASPTFTADLVGSYEIQLVVSDGFTESQPDTVVVVSTSDNVRPVANAGDDQNVSTGSVVNLDGSESSDADGDALIYQWSLISKPSGSSAELTGSTASTPSFIADTDGSYVAQLIVHDGEEDSLADTVTVTAATVNSQPVANAGDNRDVIVGSTVSLDGTGSSDADGDVLTYSWSFTSTPTGSTATIDYPQSEAPSFVADVEGSYVVQLTVDDGVESSAEDTVTIQAVPPRVRLYKDSGLFSVNYSEVSFPYSLIGSTNAAVAGKSFVSLGKFKLVAEGADFTISKVSATDSTDVVSPYFTNLSEGYLLVDGSEVIFELISPLTGGATVSLDFSFEVEETGETFSAKFSFTSN
ncbi:PKD domain-containing protein [uncultured Microbulbifer sp.]|uniref:PKD domain-containing protein n=1 Tax=uncultured Microbulbifer sp. TaxID=348147 RepID=UPI002602F230|nr:PKD domain-containing protein [uncultured Microbulbifer sp.]